MGRSKGGEMKVYIVQFFDNNDGDGAEFYTLGVFSSFDIAHAKLQEHIAKNKINIRFIVDKDRYPQWLGDCLYRCSPKYGEFTIKELKLDTLIED